MPWRCPACQEQIRHSQAEREPYVGVVYRCHICRLELLFDPIRRLLRVVPFPVDDDVSFRVPRATNAAARKNVTKKKARLSRVRSGHR
jgi:hypothetical protein